MSITIHPRLASKLRERAVDELQSLALEGLNSGDPIEGGPAFWEERRRRLEERLKS
jgi:hypothetical protein